MNVDQSAKPRLGQIVKIHRGREAGKFAIVIGIIDRKMVKIADGDKRKFDHPKKKNLLHLQLIDEISKEVVDSIGETGRVSNGKLRFALNQFVEKQQIAHEKGE